MPVFRNGIKKSLRYGKIRYGNTALQVAEAYSGWLRRRDEMRGEMSSPCGVYRESSRASQEMSSCYRVVLLSSAYPMEIDGCEKVGSGFKPRF